MNLADMCDKIEGYHKLLKEQGFIAMAAGGKKAWSHRYTKGDLHVDTRNSEWTVYEGDTEVMTGTDPETLSCYLKGDHEVGTGLCANVSS